MTEVQPTTKSLRFVFFRTILNTKILQIVAVFEKIIVTHGSRIMYLGVKSNFGVKIYVTYIKVISPKSEFENLPQFAIEKDRIEKENRMARVIARKMDNAQVQHDATTHHMFQKNSENHTFLQ